MTWQRVRIEIPEHLNSTERFELASEIIEFIKNRTQSGKNVRNRPFPKYSKSYFKSGTVDLTLSEDMLSDMRLISHNKGSLLIGYENGTKSNGKAEGNALGTYGQPSPIPGKARPFLGITQKDLRLLVRDL